MQVFKYTKVAVAVVVSSVVEVPAEEASTAANIVIVAHATQRYDFRGSC